MSTEDFMKSALARWVQLFSADEISYSDLCDGVFLTEVMQQIDLKANSTGININVNEFKERLHNWDILITIIQSFYQDFLQQFVIMRFPDIVAISRNPYSDRAQVEIERALLLILGCAVQCEQRQLFIEKIKGLDISTQQQIVDFIKEVKDCPRNILAIESIGEKLNDASDTLYGYVVQLLQERQENRSQIQELILMTEEDPKSSEGCSAPEATATLTHQTTNISGMSTTASTSISLNRSDLLAQMRKLTEELDEKVEDIHELREELSKLKHTLEKLRNENLELIHKASSARAYRDELDIVREKANVAGKYEMENEKLRDKLNELEFLRARVKELSTENMLLVESNLETEEQLLISEKRIEAVVGLESQLMECKNQMEIISEERDAERLKMHDLAEENAQLRIERKNSQSQNISLEEELKSAKMKSYSSTSMSLSDQLSEMAGSKLLRLELENQRLRKQISENRSETSNQEDNVSKLRDVAEENSRLCVRLETLEKTIVDEKRDVAEFKRLNDELSETKTNLEGTLRSVSEDLESRIKDLEEEKEELKMTIESARDRNEDLVDRRLRNLGNENEKLRSEYQIVCANLAKINLELQQVLAKHEKLVDESLRKTEAIEKEKEAVVRENGVFKNTIAGLEVFYEKYGELEERESDLRLTNERLSKKLATTDDLRNKNSLLEEENAKTKMELECVRRSVDSLKNSSSKIAHLEHEKDVLDRQLLQLQRSLDSSKLDRLAYATLEHDLASAVDEKIQLKRHLAVISSNLESVQTRCNELDGRNEQLQSSVDVYELASKRYDKTTHENEVLEYEIRSVAAEKSTLEKECGRLKSILGERKRTNEELCGKLADAESANKSLRRMFDRSRRSTTDDEGREEMTKQETRRSLTNEREIDEMISPMKQEMENARDKQFILVEQMRKQRMHNTTTSSRHKRYSDNRLEELIASNDCLQMGDPVAMEMTYNNSKQTIERHLRSDDMTTMDNIDHRSQFVDNISGRISSPTVDRWKREMDEADGTFSIESTPRRVGKETGNGNLTSEEDLSNGTSVAAELRSDLVKLERKNATLEEENRTLKNTSAQLEEKLGNAEIQVQRISSELSSIRGQSLALRAQLERLQAESSSMAPKNAVLEAQNSALHQECSRTESKVAQVKDEQRKLSLINVRLEKELDESRRVREALVAENESSKSQLPSLESKCASVEEELTKFKERFLDLTTKNEELTRWKSDHDDRKNERSNDLSPEYAEAKMEIVRLTANLLGVRKDYDGLLTEHKNVKDELNRSLRKQSELKDALADSKEQLNAAEIEMNRLLAKCDSYSRMQLKLEDEIQMLMVQMQSLMKQNQELLTQILNSKDHFAEEQKAYLQQLSDLKRQKEKLEEKIMEQYKQKDITKKKKGFGAFMKRTFKKDKKNDNSSNDVVFIPGTSSSQMTADGNRQNREQEINLENININSYKITPNAAAVNDVDNSRERQKHANVSFESTTVDDDEEVNQEITLSQFLEECNQTPMARKRLLTAMKIDTTENNASSSESKPSHRSSLLTIFHPLTPRSDDDCINRSRLFKSEINLLQLSPKSDLYAENGCERSLEDIGSVRDGRDRKNSSEFRRRRLEFSDESRRTKSAGSEEDAIDARVEGRISRDENNVKVVVTEAEVTLNPRFSSYREADDSRKRFDDDDVADRRRISMSSGSSSVLSSRDSSRHNRSSSSMPSVGSPVTKNSFSRDDDELDIREPRKNDGRSGKNTTSKRGAMDGRTTGDDCDHTENSSSSAAPYPYASRSDEADVASAASSAGSSSGSDRRQPRPIPFIDESAIEELTWRESKVCI